MSLARLSPDPRRSPREDVFHRCIICGPGLEPDTALMVNVSAFGCMLRSAASVEMGDLLTLELPVVKSWHGRVVWAVGARIGVEFEPPIDSAPYLAMLAKLNRDGHSLGTY